MSRIPKLLALVGALVIKASACADPAAGITADDASAHLDGDSCRNGLIGPTGGRDCPPPPDL